ncbi:MAG: DinB family protein [Caldilinea sp. CFX5]|nr:DinB family protein [Caldilinea sp. CFX5]
MEPSTREQRILERPTGYDPLIAPWVSMLEATRRRTKAAVQEISDQVVDWTPPERGNTIGTLLYHIMAIELSYLYEDILQVTDFPQELAQLVVYDVRDGEGQLTVVRGEPESHFLQIQWRTGE